MLRKRLRRAQDDNRTAIALPKALLACLCGGMIVGSVLPLGAQKMESSSTQDRPPHNGAHGDSHDEETSRARPAGEGR